MEQNQQKQDPAHGTNIALWERWRHVAPGMLKEIKGGNLNGKSDINPIWRSRALTEAFGPCGFGWTVKEVERWTNECAGETAAFVKVHLRIRYGNEWSEPIEGTGGSKLCGKGRGDGINDEAWKMATTDAVSVACKMLGMAADVYTGQQSHKDDDQKKSGGDYGSKYEPRNYGQNSTRGSQAGGITTQPQRGQTRAAAAPAAGGYGTGPAYAGNGQPYQAPAPAPAPAQQHPRRITVTMDIVNAGKAHNLVTALSGHDYDDLPDWQAGLQELRAKYDFAPGVIEKIEQLAVQEREARLAPRIPAQASIHDLPV